jgi:hypothetical protein
MIQQFANDDGSCAKKLNEDDCYRITSSTEIGDSRNLCEWRERDGVDQCVFKNPKLDAMVSTTIIVLIILVYVCLT